MPVYFLIASYKLSYLQWQKQIIKVERVVENQSKINNA